MFWWGVLAGTVVTWLLFAAASVLCVFWLARSADDIEQEHQ